MTGELIIQPSKDVENIMIDYEKEIENCFKILDLRGDTPKTYKNGVMAFINYLNDNGITIINKEVLIQYKQYLKETMSPRTGNTYLSGLRCFFKYLSDKGIPNLMTNIKNFKIKQHFSKLPIPIEKFIEIDETLKAERHDEKTYRDYALWSLAVRCMLREIEMVRSNKKDIVKMEDKYVLWIQGKGRDTKDEIAILEEDVIIPIIEYLEIRGKDNYCPLFTSCSSNHKGERLTTRSVSRIFKNILIRFGLDSPLFTGHSTRHTGAIQLRKSGKADLQDIQEVLRHQDINTTTIYTEMDDRLERPMEKVLQDFLREERERYYANKQSYSNC